jgi:hypothetical protein
MESIHIRICPDSRSHKASKAFHRGESSLLYTENRGLNSVYKGLRIQSERTSRRSVAQRLVCENDSVLWIVWDDYKPEKGIWIGTHLRKVNEACHSTQGRMLGILKGMMGKVAVWCESKSALYLMPTGRLAMVLSMYHICREGRCIAT